MTVKMVQMNSTRGVFIFLSFDASKTMEGTRKRSWPRDTFKKEVAG